MSIISALRTYIATYSGLKVGAPLTVDRLSLILPGYAIIPSAGGKVLEAYVDGGSLREYPFLLRSVRSTADDLERLETSGFYESFADWLDQQTRTGVLPTLDAGKTAEFIETTGWSYIYEEGDNEGIYQVQCRLVYRQQP